MKLKKFLQLIFICVFAMASLTLTAVADTAGGDYAIRMEDMNCAPESFGTSYAARTYGLQYATGIYFLT